VTEKWRIVHDGPVVGGDPTLTVRRTVALGPAQYRLLFRPTPLAACIGLPWKSSLIMRAIVARRRLLSDKLVPLLAIMEDKFDAEDSCLES
jgi:hypothetical protein